MIFKKTPPAPTRVDGIYIFECALAFIIKTSLWLFFVFVCLKMVDIDMLNVIADLWQKDPMIRPVEQNMFDTAQPAINPELKSIPMDGD